MVVCWVVTLSTILWPTEQAARQNPSLTHNKRTVMPPITFVKRHSIRFIFSLSGSRPVAKEQSLSVNLVKELAGNSSHYSTRIVCSSLKP